MKLNRIANADEVFRRALTSSAAFHDQLRSDLLKRLREMKRSGATVFQMLQEAQRIIESYVDPLAEVLANANAAAWINSAGRAAGVIAKPSTSAGESASPLGPTLLQTTPAIDVEWQGMKTWLPMVKEATEQVRNLRVVTRDEWDALDRQARAEAFTVAGQESRKAITKIQEGIVQAVDKGTGLTEFVDDLDEAVVTSPLGPGHLENVFRTGVGKAYANAQEQLASRPLIRDQFPYRMRMPIRDSRLTELCYVLARSGIQGTAIYRADDPVWAQTRPLSHYQCRCGVRLLSVEDAAGLGITEAREWHKSGEPPATPAFVPWPNVKQPPGWSPDYNAAA